MEGLEDPDKLDQIRKNCHQWLIENCQTNENVCDRRGYHERVLSVLHFVHTVSFFSITDDFFLDQMTSIYSSFTTLFFFLLNF